MEVEEVEEAKEEMIEVEAARVILEDETRCLFFVWRLCHFLKLVRQLSSSKIGNILPIVSGGKFYQKDGERRGYDPEVFSRIFWEQEEEEERFGQSNISSTGFSIFFHNHNLY